MIRTAFIVLFGLFFCGSSVIAETAGAAPTLRVGVSEFAEGSINQSLIPVTLKSIQKALTAEVDLSVRYLSVSELQRAVKAGEIDVVISSAGTFRRLAIAGTGIRDVATMASERAPDPNYADASVFFVKADRSDIRTVSDLYGKQAAAMHTFAFSGWQIAAEELFKRGFNPDRFFSDVLFQGHDASKIITAVLNDEVDVGIVRACFMEDNGVDQSRFKLIGLYESDGKINCSRSTAAYPNWTLSVLPSNNPELTRRIASVLFSLEPIEHNLHWSVATDFRPIDQLFWDLKIGPYEYLRHFNFKRFIYAYWQYILPVLMLLVGLVAHVFVVSWVVRKRTAELQASREREKAIEKTAVQANARLEKIQRAGIVGQMSTMIAHELSQPLGTISFYATGLRNRAIAGHPDEHMIISVMEKIKSQVWKASTIVDQVRSYARGDRQRENLDVLTVAAQSLGEVQKASRGEGAEIATIFDKGPLTVEANRLELELIIVNLLRNALEASAGIPEARVELRIERADDEVHIVVTNTAVQVTGELLDNLNNPYGLSEKLSGLGLGLLIVKSIVDDLCGELHFSEASQGGVCSQVSLPLAD